MSTETSPANKPRRRVHFSPELEQIVKEVVTTYEKEEMDVIEKKPKQGKLSRLFSVMESLLWIALAVGVFLYTDFGNTALFDSRVNRLYFQLGVGSLSMFVAIGFYLVVWCSWWCGEDDWDSVSPHLVPVASGGLIGGFVLCTIGLWPVWTYFAPVIIFILMMGACMPFTLV